MHSSWFLIMSLTNGGTICTWFCSGNAGSTWSWLWPHFMFCHFLVVHIASGPRVSMVSTVATGAIPTYKPSWSCTSLGPADTPLLVGENGRGWRVWLSLQGAQGCVKIRLADVAPLAPVGCFIVSESH